MTPYASQNKQHITKSDKDIRGQSGSKSENSEEDAYNSIVWDSILRPYARGVGLKRK